MVKKLMALAMVLVVLSTSFVAFAGDAASSGAKTESVLNYSQFLGTEGLQGVYDSKTPRSAEELEIKWTKVTGSGWNDVPGSPIVVGNYVYCYSSQYLRKYDLETGEELAKAQVFGVSTNQFFIHLAYGDGKIFVPVKTNNMDDGTGVTKAHLRVFDADTLEQLYITEDIMSGDMQTPVMYHDGYVVTGGYFRGSYYACFTTSDDDPAKKDEVKKAVWSVPTANTKGFCWNGAAFVGDYVFFAENGYRGSSTVWSVNYKTGVIADQFSLPDGYDSKSTIVYYDKNNRLYIPSCNSDGGASIRSYEVNPDGTLNQSTVNEWKSDTNGDTQSTPVIYNNRLYIAGSGQSFRVLQADTMEEIYKIDGLATKGSAAVSTAYATKENGNQVYIYMVPYNCNGENNFWIISDKEGQTEPKYETATVGSNYCSQTVAVAPNGYLVWYQDDKTLYVCGRKDSETASAVTSDDVNAQIARQADPAGFGYYNKVEIARIEERYAALSDTEKEKVTEYGKLLEIKKVMQFEGTNAVERLNTGIAALPETITLDDRDTVQLLLGIYNGLSDADKENVANAEKLLAADAAIKRLDTEAKIAALEKEIAALPDAAALTSADSGMVKALMSQLEALDEADQKAVSGAAELTAAFERITAIEKQMADVKTLIKDKLEGQKITLDSAEDLKAIDKAMEGLSVSDIALITEVEQFLSPAKVDMVNLLLEKLGGISVTEKNAAEIKELLAEITYFYDGVRAEDQKYIDGYEKAAAAQKAIEALEQLPQTGESRNMTLILTISLFSLATAGAVFVKKKVR